jgi:hypothetical protein
MSDPLEPISKPFPIPISTTSTLKCILCNSTVQVSEDHKCKNRLTDHIIKIFFVSF